MSHRSCGHYVTSPRSRGDCAKRMDTRCQPLENLRAFTRVPGHSWITFSTSAPLTIIQSRPGRDVLMTGHGSFANVGSAEWDDSISAHTHTHAHTCIYGSRDRGGGVVAFYEPPTSELGQPRPRAPHNHGGVLGRMEFSYTKGELHGVCLLPVFDRRMMVVDPPLAFREIRRYDVHSRI